jgi:hypothetical protein
VTGPPDAVTVAALVEQALRDRDVGRARCRRVVVVDDKPGRRAVLRAELAEPVVWPDRPAATMAALYVKWSVDVARGARNHATLEVLDRALAGSVDGPALPAAIAHLPAVSLQLLGEVAGVTLAEAGLPLDASVAERLGRSLAAFHHGEVDLPSRYSLADEARTLRSWTAELEAAGCPAPLVDRYRTVTEAALAATAGVDLRDDGVVHRDLHEEHCILLGPGRGSGSGIGVIDLDEARRGDPVVDLGHLAVHLHLRGGAGDADLEHGPAGPLLAAWVRAAPRPVRAGDLRAFGALACIKIARQRATGYGTAPRPVGPDRWPAVATALGLAESLLARV